jgi:hypothetical protein
MVTSSTSYFSAVLQQFFFNDLARWQSSLHIGPDLLAIWPMTGALRRKGPTRFKIAVISPIFPDI